MWGSCCPCMRLHKTSRCLDKTPRRHGHPWRARKREDAQRRRTLLRHGLLHARADVEAVERRLKVGRITGAQLPLHRGTLAAVAAVAEAGVAEKIEGLINVARTPCRRPASRRWRRRRRPAHTPGSLCRALCRPESERVGEAFDIAREAVGRSGPSAARNSLCSIQCGRNFQRVHIVRCHRVKGVPLAARQRPYQLIGLHGEPGESQQQRVEISGLVIG